ncbi:hypothetical protein Zmor_025004 [Zophobas morio]|uniref:Uncharacterized protein n=1 Tax=Zophobas morio TaxID=2755281 RepID=A0AA38HRA5_9CUCU|nr:hypothetical protein Zmor_025004 [Zophobas morio]
MAFAEKDAILKRMANRFSNNLRGVYARFGRRTRAGCTDGLKRMVNRIGVRRTKVVALFGWNWVMDVERIGWMAHGAMQRSRAGKWVIMGEG